MNIVYNCNCMEYMKTLPDNAFDLAVVDPPYGNAESGETIDHLHSRQREQERAREYGATDGTRFGGRFDKYKLDRTGRTRAKKYGRKIISWDLSPGKDYFSELFRVSKNQIIWGGNYFLLPPTRCFLIWEKTNIPDNFSMAQAEYAWTSFFANAKVFKFSSGNQPGRFHPTQKPVELYRWIFANYAKPGDKILDTHLGSGSSRIAAYDAGLDFVGCEIDAEYFRLQEQRFADYSSQINLFVDG